MTTLGVGRETRRRLTSPRIAETVADELRRQIVDGELADGDLLPPQAVLVERFNVSLVSLREALRILETEGLVSVRRGNQGGCRGARPDEGQRGLHARTGPAERARAARATSAPRCGIWNPPARRWPPNGADRVTTIVPELQRLNAAMSENLDDGTLFTDLGRQFHDAVVRGCGNSTVTAVIGSLEALWSSHEQRWAERSAAAGDYPSTAERKAVLKTHTALTDAIELGDPERARRIASRHLADAQTYVLSENGHQRIIATSTHTRPRLAPVVAIGRAHGSPGATPATHFVTGGSGGIGKACGRTLVERGYDVILTARREAPLREAAEEIGARWVVADASDPAGFAAALADLTRVDLLVHAAGVLGGTYARKQTFEQWRTTMSANLDSCFVVTHAALPKMVPGSRFVFVSSSAAHEPMPGRTAYSAIEGRHERVRAGAGARSRPRRHQRQHRHPRTGGNRDAAGCSIRDACHHRRRRRRHGGVARHRRDIRRSARDQAQCDHPGTFGATYRSSR